METVQCKEERRAPIHESRTNNNRKNAQNGRSFRYIAKVIGRTPPIVADEVLINGGRTGYNAFKSMKKAKQMGMFPEYEVDVSDAELEERKNSHVPLGYEEQCLIRKMIDQGYSLSSIAPILKRGKNTIVLEVRKNGGRIKYEAKSAQEQAEKKRLERIQKSSVNGKSSIDKMQYIHQIKNRKPRDAVRNINRHNKGTEKRL